MTSKCDHFSSPMRHLYIFSLLIAGTLCQNTLKKKTNCHFFINNEGNYPQKKTATCARRHISDVPPNNAVGIVNVLDLGGNEIGSLHEDSFPTWPDLEELLVNDNKLVTITRKAFVHLKKLKRLSLSGNNIGLPDCMSPLAFKPIPYLEFLDLSLNPLFLIPNRYFERLKNLKELRISHAKHPIKLLPYSFAGLNQLRVLDLTDNGLRRLPSTGMKECLSNMSLEELLLGGRNFWECDCKMRWLKMWLVQKGGKNEPKYKTTEVSKETPIEPICAGPKLVKGQALFGPMIQITDFQCEPVVRNKPAKYIRPMHSNLTLFCIIYSDPKGAVAWYKDGVLVQKHWNRAKVSQTQGVEFRAELLIIDLQPSDAGEWLCLARNRRGRATMNFTVEVVVPGHSSQTLTRIIIYCGIGAVGALLLCVGIGLVAYCLNCRRKDYRGYNKGTAGTSSGGLAETRRLHTPTDAANPATDESDYEPTADHSIPPPPPPPPPLQAIGTTPLGPALLDGTMTMPGRKSSQQALLAANLSGPAATLDRKAGTLRLEKVPLTSTIAQHDANSNNIAFPCSQVNATLTRPTVALTAQPPTSQHQRDHCPVHGTPTGSNYRTDGHYSPCPVHGDATLAAAAVNRNSLSAASGSGPVCSTSVNTSGQGSGHNNPLYGTMPSSGRYKPCPLHGDMYATLQTRQAGGGGPVCTAGHHAGLQSPSQGSNASSTTMTLQTIMRSKDNAEGPHATYIRASRVDDCIGGSPGGCGSVTAQSVSGNGPDLASGQVNGAGTLAKTKSAVPNVSGTKLEDEGYSTSV